MYTYPGSAVVISEIDEKTEKPLRVLAIFEFEGRVAVPKDYDYGVVPVVGEYKLTMNSDLGHIRDIVTAANLSDKL